MRLLSCLICLIAAVSLSGCVSTHHEEFSSASTVGIGPNGVASTSDGSYSARDWTSPWLAQPERVRP